MKKFFVKILFCLVLVVSIGGFEATVSFAAEPTIPKPTYLPGCKSDPNQPGGTFTCVLQNFLPNFMAGFFGIIAATSVVMLIVGGLQLLLAFGNEEKLGTAKKTLTWAVGGLALAIFSYAIIQILNALPFGK